MSKFITGSDVATRQVVGGDVLLDDTMTALGWYSSFLADFMAFEDISVALNWLKTKLSGKMAAFPNNNDARTGWPPCTSGWSP